MAISEAIEFCQSKNIDLIKLDTTQDPFNRTKLWDEAVNSLADEASKRNYFSLVNNVNSLYKAVLPDTAVNEFAKTRFLLERLADKIRQEIAETDISEALEKFQKMIDDYNSGSRNQEIFFRELIKFHEELTTEEKRHLAENLTDEELVIFDLLTKPELDLTKQENKR